MKMHGEWEFSRTTGKCAVTGRTFAEGDVFCAVLFETPTGLERRDTSQEAWTGPPEGCFCYWRGRIPTRTRKKPLLGVDQGVLSQLFLRLEDEESEMKQQLRFVLTLLLMRKRIIKLEQAIKEGGREYWQVRLVKEQSVHQVLNPRLTDEQVRRLSGQLTAILSGDLEAVDSAAELEAEAGEQESVGNAPAAPADAAGEAKQGAGPGRPVADPEGPMVEREGPVAAS